MRRRLGKMAAGTGVRQPSGLLFLGRSCLPSSPGARWECLGLPCPDGSGWVAVLTTHESEPNTLSRDHLRAHWPRLISPGPSGLGSGSAGEGLGVCHLQLRSVTNAHQEDLLWGAAGSTAGRVEGVLPEYTETKAWPLVQRESSLERAGSLGQGHVSTGLQLCRAERLARLTLAAGASGAPAGGGD